MKTRRSLPRAAVAIFALPALLTLSAAALQERQPAVASRDPEACAIQLEKNLNAHIDALSEAEKIRFAKARERMEAATVLVVPGGGSNAGSGVVVKNRAGELYLLTAGHNLSRIDPNSAHVRFRDGGSASITPINVLHRDKRGCLVCDAGDRPLSDLAIARINADAGKMPFVALADGVVKGERSFLLGYGGGWGRKTGEGIGNVEKAALNDRSKKLTALTNIGVVSRILDHHLIFSPGGETPVPPIAINSGGPLFNSDGNLIGIIIVACPSKTDGGCVALPAIRSFVDEETKGKDAPSGGGKATAVTLVLSDNPPIDGNPYIRAKVNGVEGLFLLDTGMVSTDNTISPKSARKFALKNNVGTLTLDDGKGGTISLDGQYFAGTPFGGGDGVLGRAFFDAVKMTIDYPQKRATFERYPEKETAEGEKPEGATIVPFRFLKVRNTEFFEKGPFVDAVIDGKKVLLVLDTGANWSSLNVDTVNNLGLKTAREKVHGVTYDVAHVKMTIGDLVIDDAPFAKLTNPMLANTTRNTGETVAGIVGNNILSRYRITFDYRNRKAFFIPVK